MKRTLTITIDVSTEWTAPIDETAGILEGVARSLRNLGEFVPRMPHVDSPVRDSDGEICGHVKLGGLS